MLNGIVSSGTYELTNPILFDENQECKVTYENETISAGMYALIEEIGQGVFVSRDKKTMISVDASYFSGLTTPEEIINAYSDDCIIGIARLAEEN